MINNILDDISVNEQISCEYLVVGSGAGGSVSAYEFAKSNKDTLLIEEGNNYSIDYFKGSIGNSFNEVWRNSVFTPVIGENSFGFGEGKCLGGSTYINGGLIWRTPTFILEKWNSYLHSDKFKMEKLKPYFEIVEKKLNVILEKNENNYNNDSKILEKISKDNNLECVAVPRAVLNCKRENKCTTGCVSGAKQTVLQNYIYPALNLGLKVMVNTRVEKILLRNNIPNRVIVRKNNKYIEIKFKKIILACGPIQTPLLIKKSFGNSCLKSEMQIHLNFRINAVFDEEINSSLGTIFTRQIQEFIKEGILIMPTNFNKSYLSSGLSNYNNNQINMILEKINNMATYVIQMKSSNSIKISNIYKHPFLFYKFSDSDFEKIKKYLRTFSKYLFNCKAKKIYLPFKNNVSFNNLKSVDLALSKLKKKHIETLSVHGMSSAKMSNDKSENSFFDVDGKSFYFKNVYGVDSSILPSNTVASPQGTIMAFSHLISKNILEN